jgi:hypothetical protein
MEETIYTGDKLNKTYQVGEFHLTMILRQYFSILQDQAEKVNWISGILNIEMGIGRSP